MPQMHAFPAPLATSGPTSCDTRPRMKTSHVVPAELGGKSLDAVVRALFEVSWGKARGYIETGKIEADGEVVTVVERRVRAGVTVSLDLAARRPRPDELEKERIVFVDAHVVVVNKPAGISTVPYDDTETGTLDERVRAALQRSGRERGQRPPLGVVHRIDKETTGLVVFTRSWLAKQSLASQFRVHSVHRLYRAMVHGVMTSRSLTSHLVEDRGDGLRGSIERMKGNRPRLEAGQRAVTHVDVDERLSGGAAAKEGATLVTCRLETGRTHQIRVHLSEVGHPLIGERVYCREYSGERIPAPRLMLHAAELGFLHPKTEEPMKFTVPVPADFAETLARLRAKAP